MTQLSIADIFDQARAEHWEELALVRDERNRQWLRKAGWDAARTFIVERQDLNLGDVVSCRTLERLAMRDCAIGSEGARALANWTGLTFLDLSANSIGDDGARALASLTGLTSLDLSANSIGFEGVRALASLPSLTSVDLSRNSIGDDGALALASLTSLTSLYLHASSIGSTGALALANLTGLTSLHLSINRIGDKGALALATLTGLTSLALMQNGIGDEGARALATLTRLTDLSLADNIISDEGALALGIFTSLTSLDLRNNSIGEEGARALAKLTGLTSLALRNNSIGDEGARALATLTGLTSLDLLHNNIGDEGARALATLTGLTSLDLSFNSIGEQGARALRSLTGLTSLDLSFDSSIGDGGARALAGLDGLTSLALRQSNIGDEGAMALATFLTRLTHLDLMNNSIGDEGARALATMTSLTSLHLGWNSIGDDGARALFEGWAGPDRPNNLRLLRLQDNNITFLPKEILDTNDAQAILAYYRRYQSSTNQPLNEAKLLVVGNEAVGKTSLVRYLTTGKPRDPDEKKTLRLIAHDRIEIQSWSLADQGPRLNVWDFGGQEMLHETHKFFLTERSVYLLVLEDRREDDTSIFKWLRTISNRGGDSPIIVVINKCDDNLPTLLLDETTIAREWPGVIGFVRTSCNADEVAGQTIEALKAKILETLQHDPRLAHIRDPLPNPWRRVKEALAEFAEHRRVLSHIDFVHLCENAEGAEAITDENEQRGLLQLLHNLGVIVAHGLRQDAPAALQNVTILDPNWLTGAIYKVLTAGLVVQQGGVFRREQLAELLDPNDYPRSRWEFILSMMQLDQMGLCFPLRGSTCEEYLVPEALPKNAPNYDTWPNDSLRFRFDYEFLPPGLVPRFIVEAHAQVTSTRWRAGAVLTAAGCSVLVTGNPGKNRLDILVDGPEAMRRSALNVVLEHLERVHALNPEIKPTAKVPLPHTPEVTVSFQHLRMLEERYGPKYKFVPEGSNRECEVGELLGGVGRNLRSQHKPSPKVAASLAPQFDVLIITALPEELDALLKVSAGLRVEWTKVDAQPRYYTATFDGINGNAIRVAATRLVKMGSAAMGSAATSLVDALKPRSLAMCGVCAGHPEETDLGDVVISERVFYYDEGTLKNTGFRGDLWVNPLNVPWLYVAQELVGPAAELHGYAEASIEDSQWWLLEQLLAERNPLKSAAFGRYFPDDRRSELLLKLRDDRGLVCFNRGLLGLTDTGRDILQEYLTFHAIEAQQLPYHIHVGPIGSGSHVRADGEIWKTLPVRMMLAVETDSVAVGHIAKKRSLPFIVVKGVMDHANQYKTDRFKPFAARASAEVLLRFLRTVPHAGGDEKVIESAVNTVTYFIELNSLRIVREIGDSFFRIEGTETALSRHLPVHGLMVADRSPDKSDLDFLELQSSDHTKTDRVSLLFYHQPPDVSTRVHLAMMRAESSCAIIPLSLNEIDQTNDAGTAAARKLLSDYYRRYVGEDDLFDERSAVTDSLLFYGRTGLLESIRHSLSRGESVAVYGLRKLGKTSLLNRLKHIMGWSTAARIDCGDFWLSPNAEHWLNRVYLALGLDDMSNDTLVERLRATTNISADLTHPRVLMLDEVERIIPRKHSTLESVVAWNRFFSTLRAACQEGLLALVVADIDVAIGRSNHWPHEDVDTNPVYQFFKEIHLGMFTKQDVREMISGIGKLMRVNFEEEALDVISSASGGHPFLARQLASIAVSAAHTDRVSVTDAIAASTSATTLSGSVSDYLFAVLEDVRKRGGICAQHLICQVANGSAIWTEATAEERSAIRTLKELDLVSAHDGAVHIKMGLLSTYLRETQGNQ